MTFFLTYYLRSCYTFYEFFKRTYHVWSYKARLKMRTVNKRPTTFDDFKPRQLTPAHHTNSLQNGFHVTPSSDIYNKRGGNRHAVLRRHWQIHCCGWIQNHNAKTANS